MKTLAIIGGGAAGLAAAVTAARQARLLAARESGAGSAGADGLGAGGVRVVLYEADERVGRSILATGNGRCNFSNAQASVDAYRNSEYVRDVLLSLAGHREQVLGSKAAKHAVDTSWVTGVALRFFESLGLVWREEDDGRLYPLANKASSVLDVLRGAADRLGVQVRCCCRAVQVDAPSGEGDRFHIRFADGRVEHAHAVVVAVGGRASGGLVLPGGLERLPLRPVLGPLRTDTDVVKQLNNIRVKCAVQLWRQNPMFAKANPDGLRDEARYACRSMERDSIERPTKSGLLQREGLGTLLAVQRGELMFRDYGVSGIAVFNLSRFAQPGDALCIDFLPHVRPVDTETYLLTRRKRMHDGTGAWPTCEDALGGLLLPQVARAVLKESGVRAQGPFDKDAVHALASVLKGLPLKVRGVGDERQCQVMRGGLGVSGFDARTCEARAVPGLYAAGEALDVDAPCGGFNLHWAWASGLLAATSAVQRLAGAAE